MPYLLDDQSYERVKETVQRVLGQPPNDAGQEHFYGVRRPTTHHAVYVTGAPTGGRWPAKLQWRDEEEEEWVDFKDESDDPVTVLAIPYNDGDTLASDRRYHGMLVSLDEYLGEVVYACTVGGGGGGGETGFWGRVLSMNCRSGSYVVREQVVRPNGGYTDREPVGDFDYDYVHHANKQNFQEGPLVEPGTICWVRRGWPGSDPPSTQEYIIDCPAGYTGEKQITVDVICQDGSIAQLKWWFFWWNGQLTREPCVGRINICGPCSTHPFTPGFGSFLFRAGATILAALGAGAGALL